MSLESGTRLGQYEILSALGAGGMGEVYRAHDTRLNRQVALKVLPDAALAGDPQRRVRFEREAQVLASLNHPNIAAIYGLEQSGATPALVMELVEGETLAELAGRPRRVPLHDTLMVARQVAEALEYAHDRSVVHRDLKPANVKLTPDGAVKVLDFGLAKALGPDETRPDMANSPTFTTPLTQAGFILGTAAYMAPEQAKGKSVDRRADIWAFGCVLYELLAGRRAFDGETVSEVLAAVLMKEPDWSALPDTTPPAVERLLRRCLQRDPRQRLQAIGEARIAIDATLSAVDAPPGVSAAAGAAPTAQAEGRSLLRRALPWTLAGALAVALAGVAAVWRFSSAAPELFPVLSYIPPPADTTFREFGFGAGPVVVSPDGRRLAFSATDQDGVTALYLRSLASGTVQRIAGTEDAGSSFWSPDGDSIGFVADRKLKTVNVANGSVQVLTDVSQTTCVPGGAWSPDGTIVFAPHGCYGSLARIAVSGGQVSAATTLARNEVGHAWPTFLPDGRHFLYASQSLDGSSAIWLGSLGSQDRMLVLKDASSPEFAAGRLLFIRGGNHVFAQTMNSSSAALSGEAVAIADAQYFSASTSGVLASQGGSIDGRLEWLDRSGNLLGRVGPTAVYDTIGISPDGARVLAEVGDYASNVTDLWSYPAAGGVGTRLTFGPDIKEFAVWSPDGRDIAYSCGPHESAICRKSSDGASAEERVAALDGLTGVVVVDWSPDGRYLSFNGKRASPPHTEIGILPVAGDRKPFRIDSADADEYDGKFSPDGRWFAYFSYESGRPEVYVVPFPGPGGKFQISQNGGYNVQWDTKGHLYFLTMGNRLIQADLAMNGASLQVTTMRPLFQTSLPGFAAPFFDVSADGSRFLVVASADPGASSSIGLLLNWPSKLAATK